MTQSLSFKWIVVCALASSSLIVKRLFIGLNDDNFTNSKYLLHRHLGFRLLCARFKANILSLFTLRQRKKWRYFLSLAADELLLKLNQSYCLRKKKTAFVSFKFCDCLKLFFDSPGKLFSALNIDFESTIVVWGGQEIIIKNIVFDRFVFLFG